MSCIALIHSFIHKNGKTEEKWKKLSFYGNQKTQKNAGFLQFFRLFLICSYNNDFQPFQVKPSRKNFKLDQKPIVNPPLKFKGFFFTVKFQSTKNGESFFFYFSKLIELFQVFKKNQFDFDLKRDSTKLSIEKSRVLF